MTKICSNCTAGNRIDSGQMWCDSCETKWQRDKKATDVWEYIREMSKTDPLFHQIYVTDRYAKCSRDEALLALVKALFEQREGYKKQIMDHAMVCCTPVTTVPKKSSPYEDDR